MALQAKVVAFQFTSGTGSQTISGVGFQGKVAIFLCGAAASIFDTGQDASISFGVATSSSSQWCAGFTSNHNQADGSAKSWILTDRCGYYEFSGGTLVSFAFSAWTSDGFQINKLSDHALEGGPVVAIVLGGDDLEEVDVGTVLLGGSSGSQAFTGVGFEPSGLLLAGSIASTTAGIQNNGILTVGATDGTSEAVAACFSANGVATTETGGVLRSDRIWTVVGSSGGSPTDEGGASLDSLDEDGFTLSVTGPPSQRLVGYLAWSGPQVKLGIETQSTSIGTKNTSLPFTPLAVLFGSAGRVSNSSPTAETRMSFGVADGTGQGSLACHDADNMSTSRAGTSIRNNRALEFVNRSLFATGVLATSTCTFDTDEFTLNWTTADATAREFWYLAFGEAESSEPIIVEVPTATIAISAVAPATAKSAALPAAGLRVNAFAPGTNKIAPLPTGNVKVSGVAPATAKIATLPAGNVKVSGVAPGTSKIAPLPTAGVGVNGITPATAKAASVPAAGVGVNGITPATAKAASVPAAGVGVSARAPATAKQTAVPTATVEVASHAPTTLKAADVPTAGISIAAQPLDGGTVANVPTAGIAVAGIAPSTAKLAPLPTAGIEVAAREPATAKAAAVPTATVQVEGLAPTVVYVAAVPTAGIEIHAVEPGTAKAAAVMPGQVVVLAMPMVEPIIVTARATAYLPVHGADPRIMTVYGVDIRPLDVTGTSPVPREVKG